ncbi:hypothetical protein D0C36_18910 [Mucilaginibacter conchicola]|uniref:Alpha/beta hydrolase n=1 Tax=Mucilaginibacter conchicola TaxID=2303333 RepID=A0A372NQ07_9SPHI|nr:alpha/beta hydrolase [Mucilaginibacter conchicola]RFZ91016.1 hypothetical protein D0C36_18910 [Mucilaginibacter conchicola]
MMKHILFIQGGGDDGYNPDKKLVDDLQNELSSDFKIAYPELRSDESAPDFGWLKQIEKEMHAMQNPFVIVAHSLGASMLLKYLSENEVTKKPSATFLLATPFWSGAEDWKQGLKLNDNFARKLPEDVPYFFYHCKDDEEVQFEQMSVYRNKIPHAAFREFENGGHMFKAHLKIIADDIKNL